MLTFTIVQAWLILSGAILFEVAGTTCMRLAEGFTKPIPSVLIFVFYAISFSLNTIVIRTLGLSIVYAVWSGVGTVITSMIGFWYFKEPITTIKILSTTLIIIGILGLYWSSRING
ncbi:membrane protein [Achromatium sp. WMS3]|nr:membrane protein [Achromatium sp. WMS3]